jgi:phosphonate transport system substrate-binding protein
MPAKRFSLVRVLVPVLLAALGCGAYYYYVVSSESEVPPVDTTLSLREFARKLKANETLAAGYADADKDLLADPPADAAKWINPAELAFCFIAQDDPTESEKAWQPLMEHLAKATGKPVKFLKTAPPAPGVEGATADELRSTEQQIQAVKEGRLHITAFNTGAVPLAVNAAGFHPLVAPANAEGKYDYQMQIIVPGSSPATKPEDLKGKTIAFVAMSSNSGGKAPLVLLREQCGMHPGRDYSYVMTGRHERSILELAAGRKEPNFDAACVASDLLEQMLADQRIDAGRFKVIFKSSSFPKVVFGVPHNLDPALRAKIVEGFKTFRFAGTTLEKKYSAEKRTGFAAVDYAKAFADVLVIDRKLIETYGTPP